MGANDDRILSVTNAMSNQPSLLIYIYLQHQQEQPHNQGNEKIKIAMSILTERDTGKQTNLTDRCT